uniref:Uncharacterized protein n=1 Tax=Solanum lycopersicum TaxID=4081 RepID=K4C0N2_SOLLC
MSRGFPRKLGLPTGGGLIQANSITALHVNLELGTGNVSKLTLMKLNDMLIVKMDQAETLTLELTFISVFSHLFCAVLDDEMICLSYEVHNLVQLLFHQKGDVMLAKLMNHSVPSLLNNIESYIKSHDFSESSATKTEDHLVEHLDAVLVYLQYLPKCCAELIFPIMTQYELLQNVYGNLRDFHELKVNGCVEYDTIEHVLRQFQIMVQSVGFFCLILLRCQLDERDENDEILVISQVESMLANLLVDIIPVELEVMHICSTNLKASKSEKVGCFIKQLQKASPHILREYLIHLQENMANIATDSTSTPLTREVSICVSNLDKNLRNKENMIDTRYARLDSLENIELLKKDLKHVFLKPPADSSQLYFPMSDGPLFMNLLLRNLNDLLNSNTYSVDLIKEEIMLVKEGLEFVRSFFGIVEQEFDKDLRTRVIGLAYEAEHAINSIIVRDHGLLHLIFLLPDTIEKIKLIKEEVPARISKSKGLTVGNTPSKPVEIKKSSTTDQIIVGFEEETEWIIRKLTSGPTEVDVISIVGMPGLGKTTLAYRVFNNKSVVDHFDVRAWCTVDQEHNDKKLLQKIFNQVVGLKQTLNEDDIDEDIADKLRKELFGKRYLIFLDDLWDIETWNELTRPFPQIQRRSRIILTSRKREVALQGKHHSDPLYLRLLTPEESWDLLVKRVFGEERCPDELLVVGEEIARKCAGLPLLLDLIGGVIARQEKKKALWLEVLNNLNSLILKDEEEVMKVIQLSYDHLPNHLKPCLLYLASYPKDNYIKISELKHLWSSEGLVEHIEMKSVDELLEVYVDELISSSLVVVFYGIHDRNPIFRIHDLVHDFCLIKSRNEHLFDVIKSNTPSSSSDLMPRAMTIHYDQHLHSDENFVLFNPEKQNPYVKHLLSLKVYKAGDIESWRPNHLRHLRLLKSLEIRQILLMDPLLNEIGMLVHLRYLNIWTKVEALPPSFSNLLNLETLMVYNSASNMVLSPSIWSLAKLRHVHMFSFSVFESHADEQTVLEEDSKLENLRILSGLKISDSQDTGGIFKRFPNIRSLRFAIKTSQYCPAEKICFPRLDVLSEREQVDANFHGEGWRDKYQCDLYYFPLSLKILKMTRFDLSSNSLSEIARLPNLENLSLQEVIIEGGKEWNMEDVTFEKLKILTLYHVSFSEWQVREESFPMLEELQIEWCYELMEIPDSFWDIASLKSIKVLGQRQLKDSALKIKEYVAEMTGDDKLVVM